MAKGTVGTWRRRLRVLLIVTSGAVLAWVASRRRTAAEHEQPARTWSPPEVTPLPPPVPEPESPPVIEPTPLVAVTEPASEAAPNPEPVSEVTESNPEPTPEPAHLFSVADEPPAGPYPGSALPLVDGSPPSEEFVIKGNTGSMRSHAPSSPYYGRTRAEVWFRTEQDAVAAGFRPWTPRK